jgi:deazaflavin-dependent oxidoreductase (nitroreductase family)
MASFNKAVTNRLVSHIAGWAPGFALITHVGRHTGRTYTTPVNVFKRDGGYLFALTYGKAEWVRNVLEAGRCSMRTRRRSFELANPRYFTDVERALVPAPARWILTLIDVEEFLAMESREPPKQ